MDSGQSLPATANFTLSRPGRRPSFNPEIKVWTVPLPVTVTVSVPLCCRDGEAHGARPPAESASRAERPSPSRCTPPKSDRLVCQKGTGEQHVLHLDNWLYYWHRANNCLTIITNVGGKLANLTKWTKTSEWITIVASEAGGFCILQKKRK